LVQTATVRAARSSQYLISFAPFAKASLNLSRETYLNITRQCRLGFLFVFFASVLCQNVNAQENGIGGDYTVCDGFILDDGLSAGASGANLNAVSVICAGGGETIVNLDFLVFNLGAGDTLRIFNGNGLGAPLIGSFGANDIEGDLFTSNNAGGCLTLQFITDAIVSGDFNAEISCGVPCIRPVSVITSSEGASPARICPGETLTFDGSASVLATGVSIANSSWDFDDGSAPANGWPAVSHTFTEPGGYRVQLSITDSEGCENRNLADYIVFVSTLPNYSLLENPESVCNGENLQIGANFNGNIPFETDSLNEWVSVDWIDLPQSDLGDGVYIEDLDCVVDELTFGNFDPNDVIDELSDFDFLRVNLEHSFLTDLNITIECPNGQSVAVHQNGGSGGIYFGEADDGFDYVPGIGFDYFWSPEVVAPTAADASFDANFAAPLPSGTYASVGNWNNLLGCPLNGTWILRICDTFGSDDGTVFSWGVAFNPDFYDNVLSFRPLYGAGCDSSFWSGPGIASLSAGCDFATLNLVQPGEYDYTYTLINDFGCVFDTTITIVVEELPLLSAGPDLLFSCEPLPLLGALQGAELASCGDDAGSYSYCYDNNENYSVTYCPDAPGDGVTFMQISITSGGVEDFWDDFIVFDGNSVGSPELAGFNWPLSGDLSGLSFTATNGSGCLTMQIIGDITNSCGDGSEAPLNYTVNCTGEQYVVQWTPAAGLDEGGLLSPTLTTLSADQVFTVTAYPLGHPECAQTDQTTVTVSSPMTVSIAAENLVCEGDTLRLAFPSIEGGTAPYNVIWNTLSGAIDADSLKLAVWEPQEICVTVEDACNGQSERCTQVLFHPIIPAGFTLDTLIGCEPLEVVFTSQYSAFQNVAGMKWLFQDGDSATTMGSATHTYWQDGYYRPMLEITDQNGCVYRDTLSQNLIVWPSPRASFSTNPEEIILPQTSVLFSNNSQDASEYEWTFAGFGTSTEENPFFTFPPERAGSYLVTLSAFNQFGCIDSVVKNVLIEDDLAVYIPNCFTPDGDNVNDTWKVEGRGFTFENFRLQVYNRWGDVIFETADPLEAWTGEVRNGAYFSPNGVYFYRLIIRDVVNDVNHLYEGHLLILR
jgi:gliding motility-associated-like protein